MFGLEADEPTEQKRRAEAALFARSSFESGEVPQDWPSRQAIAIARDAGGEVPDENILVSGSDEPAVRVGALGAVRDAFIPKSTNGAAGIGSVSGTVETSITWGRQPPSNAPSRTLSSGAPRCLRRRHGELQTG